MNTTASSTIPATTFQARHAYGVGILSVLLGIGVGAAICAGLGWASGQLLTTAATLAGIIWLFASILSVPVLVVGSGLKVDRLGMAVLASSMARMLTALMVGLIAYFIIKPEGRTFWVCFLAAGMLALIGEAFWAIRTINAAAHSTDARPTPGAA